MKEIYYPIKEILGKGLAPNNNPRNNPMLIESIGAFPYEGLLQAVEEFDWIDATDLACVFPYPQIFILSDVLLVCTATAIYEYPDITTAKISSLTEGTTWSCVDFKNFIYLTNGQVAVKKSADTGLYSLDATLPYGTCLCDYNGQVFVGSANTPASGNI